MQSSPIQIMTPMTPAVKRKFPTTNQIKDVVEISNENDSSVISGISSTNKKELEDSHLTGLFVLTEL